MFIGGAAIIPTLAPRQDTKLRKAGGHGQLTGTADPRTDARGGLLNGGWADRMENEIAWRYARFCVPVAAKNHLPEDSLCQTCSLSEVV